MDSTICATSLLEKSDAIIDGPSRDESSIAATPPAAGSRALGTGTDLTLRCGSGRFSGVTGCCLADVLMGGVCILSSPLLGALGAALGAALLEGLALVGSSCCSSHSGKTPWARHLRSSFFCI